jgi:hypothetical protein
MNSPESARTMLEDIVTKDELDDALKAQFTNATKSIYRALLLQSIAIVGLAFALFEIFD